MNTTDLNISFQVDQSPEEVYKAINNVRRWWSESIEGGTNKLQDEFTYRYPNMHYSKQRLIEMIPGKKVVWLVTESNLTFIENKNEWTDTKITFEISVKGGKTLMQFRHVGLGPGAECFDACSEGWGHYVGESLRSLITTGKGNPD